MQATLFPGGTMRPQRFSVAGDGFADPSWMKIALTGLLTLVFAGCVPWNGRRHDADRPIPTQGSSDRKITRTTTQRPNPNSADREMETPIPVVQTNTAAARIPEFQFSSHAPKWRVDQDWPLHAPPSPNRDPGLLAPLPADLPVDAQVVRVEPLEHESDIQLVVFEEFVGSATSEPTVASGDPAAALRSADYHMPNETEGAVSGKPSDEQPSQILSAAEMAEPVPTLSQIIVAMQTAWCAAIGGNQVAPCGDEAHSPPGSGNRTDWQEGYLLIGRHRAGLPVAMETTAVEESALQAVPGSEDLGPVPVTDELVRLLNEQLATLESEQASSMDPAERNYWKYQAQALLNLLNSHTQSPTATLSRQTIAETIDYLRLAIQEMESLANLTIPHAAFCTEVRGFGQYEPWGDQTVQNGQPLLIYCELRNYTSRQAEIEGEPWYVTRLRSRLVVRDPLGRIVQRAEFPLVEDLARNVRQDFYLHVPLTVGDLPPGSYRLDLVIEDVEGNKSACYQPGLSFRVR